MWVGDSFGLEFNVAHTNFIVLALVNIGYFTVVALSWISSQICRQENPHYFFTSDYSEPLHLKKNSMGNWKLVWSTLIRKNNVAN